MSTAPISTSSVFQQLQTFFQQRKSDLQQLREALQSGDLAGAQQAFNAIQTLAQSGPFAHSNAFAVNQRQQDFAAVGQALQAGDLAAAQHAFAQLRNTFNHHRPTADPVGPAVVVNLSGAASGTTPASGTQSSSSSPSSSPAAGGAPELIVNVGNSGGPEQITIGLNNSSAGEQVTISVAGQQGTAPEQITINLGHNNHEQIVLNLLSSVSSSASPDTSSQGSGVNVVA